jgi:Protein of unknown function (DUF2867)
MHIGWVPDRTGRYRGEMAVLVKPNGLLGAVYMAAIRPFRHLIVYPPLMRRIEQDWKAGRGDTDTPRSTATSPSTSEAASAVGGRE